MADGSQERQNDPSPRADAGSQAVTSDGNLLHRAQSGDARAVQDLRRFRSQRASAAGAAGAPSKPPEEELKIYGVSVEDFTDYCKHYTVRGWDGSQAAGLIEQWRIARAISKIPSAVRGRVRRQLLPSDGDGTLVMDEIGGTAVIGTREQNAERRADAQAKMEAETLANMEGGIVGAVAGGVAALRHPDDREAIHAASGVGAAVDNIAAAMEMNRGNGPHLEPPIEHEVSDTKMPETGETAPAQERGIDKSKSNDGHGVDVATSTSDSTKERQQQATPETGAHAPGEAKPLTDKTATLKAFEAMLASGEYKAKVAELQPLVAKLRSHPEWGPLLSTHSDLELMALIGYTGSDYKVINDALRGNSRELYVKLKPYIELSTDALAKLPDHSGTCLRGVRDLPPAVLAQYQTGAIVEEPGFTSTTFGTEPFKGRIQFTIETKHAKKIHFMSLYPEQKEALLPPHTQFKVLERVEVDGMIFIRMEEL